MILEYPGGPRVIIGSLEEGAGGQRGEGGETGGLWQCRRRQGHSQGCSPSRHWKDKETWSIQVSECALWPAWPPDPHLGRPTVLCGGGIHSPGPSPAGPLPPDMPTGLHMVIPAVEHLETLQTAGPQLSQPAQREAWVPSSVP